MPTAYQHRPLSKILAPDADTADEEKSAKDAPSEPKQVNEPDDSDLPEKYRGKTAKEIAEMHMNAEKELGRTRNELGTYRGLVTDLTSLQRQSPQAKTPEQEEVDVTGDQILSDPKGSIQRVVQQELKPVKEQLAADAANESMRMELTALETQFGDYSQVVLSDGFKEFANRTPSRQLDLRTAAEGEGIEQVRAARRLLEDYTDFQAATKKDEEPKAETPVEKARKVATESTKKGTPISGKPKIYESDVIALINSDQAKYRSPSFQKELTEAIREGRFVKNT